MYKYTVFDNQSYDLLFRTGSQQNGILNGGSISFNAGATGNTIQGGNTGSFVFSHGILSSTEADVAEDYPTRDDSLMVGDIVSIDPNESTFIRKTASKDDNGIVGVYSSKPGLRLSQKDSTINGGRAVPVALAGRVLVNVTNENSRI